jgi:hypothetical protein
VTTQAAAKEMQAATKKRKALFPGKLSKKRKKRVVYSADEKLLLRHSLGAPACPDRTYWHTCTCS